MSDTYSFTDVVIVFAHPDAGTYSASGQAGVGKITINMATTNTVHDVSADGNIMVSFRPGDNGGCQVEVQQTSDMHVYLLGWFNLIRTNAKLRNVDNYAAMTITVQAIFDGSTHVLTGVAAEKFPDKEYGEQGARLTWNLMAANVSNF